jgi:hypothetical protein
MYFELRVFDHGPHNVYVAQFISYNRKQNNYGRLYPNLSKSKAAAVLFRKQFSVKNVVYFATKTEQLSG